MKEPLRNQIEESYRVAESMLEEEFYQGLTETIGKFRACLAGGNKLLIAGNGGSASQAQHFAAEIVGRFKQERKGLAALSLNTDTAILTAIANDYDYSDIFSRQIESLGQSGDVFVGLSTSGNSPNILKGLQQASVMGISSVCLLGNDGGMAKDLADISFVIPSNDTARIQEAHLFMIHFFSDQIEQNLTGVHPLQEG